MTIFPTATKGKSMGVSKIPPSVPPRPSKEILAKSKFSKNVNNYKKSYAQASRSNVEDVICIKNTFPKLPTKKVIEINDIVNNKAGLKKPKINMTTKGPSRKQIIIPMNIYNSEIVGNFMNTHIANINRCLEEAKSATITDFIQVENNGIIITTNKALSASDMSVIEKYLKENDNIDSNSPHLPKSKSCLKILGLSYILEKTNLPITSDLIKEVIKHTSSAMSF